jgi:hypothetical protein
VSGGDLDAIIQAKLALVPLRFIIRIGMSHVVAMKLSLGQTMLSWECLLVTDLSIGGTTRVVVVLWASWMLASVVLHCDS